METFQSCSGKTPFTISVEGIIGSGKSTLITSFENFSSTHVVYEPVNKWQEFEGINLLNGLYKDYYKYFLPFQLVVFQTCLENQISDKNDKNIRIMERSLFSSFYCFVEKTKTDPLLRVEYEVLRSWFLFLTNQFQTELQIDQIIYLRTDPEIAFRRIKKRDRPEERDLSLEYLAELRDYHDNWLLHSTYPIPAPHVTVLDGNKELSELDVDIQNLKKTLLEKLP